LLYLEKGLSRRGLFYMPEMKTHSAKKLQLLDDNDDKRFELTVEMRFIVCPIP